MHDEFIADLRPDAPIVRSLLIENNQQLNLLSKNIKALAITDADERIADEIEKLVKE